MITCHCCHLYMALESLVIVVTIHRQTLETVAIAVTHTTQQDHLLLLSLLHGTRITCYCCHSYKTLESLAIAVTHKRHQNHLLLLSLIQGTRSLAIAVTHTRHQDHLLLLSLIQGTTITCYSCHLTLYSQINTRNTCYCCHSLPLTHNLIHQWLLEYLRDF